MERDPLPTGAEWREDQGKMRLHLWQWLVIFIAASLAIVDLSVPAVASFFVGHAVFSSVLTSLLFLAIGYTVVDWLLAEHERRRWGRVRSIALVAIGRGALNQRRAMQYSVMLEDLHIDADFEPVAAYNEVATAVERCLAGNSELQSISRNEIVANQAGETEAELSKASVGGQVDEYERRLSMLIADPGWRRASYLLLREAAHSMNRLIGRWVPALSASERGMDVLTIMSDQADRLDDLARRLDGRSLDSSPGLPLPGLWIQEQINSLLLYEWLMSQAKELSYFSSARKEVPRSWDQFMPAAAGGGICGVRLALRENGTVVEEHLRV
jgi:hypothetical protein